MTSGTALGSGWPGTRDTCTRCSSDALLPELQALLPDDVGDVGCTTPSSERRPRRVSRMAVG